MSATYTAGGVDPISRMRAAVRDTSTTSPIFPDEEYYRWLDSSLSAAHVAIYYPSSGGATSATARVLMSGANLVLQLQRVPLDGSTSSVTLAPSDKPFIHQLIDGISALNKGWIVGIGDDHGTQWLDITSTPWGYPSRPMLAVIAEHGKAANLALQRQGTLSALGDQYTYARLPFYLYASALSKALVAIDGLDGADGPYTSRSAGGASWTRKEVSGRLGQLSGAISQGIFAEVA